MRSQTLVLAVLLVALTTGLASAQATAPVPDTAPHPRIIADREWAGVMVIAIVGLFITAAIVGPIVRANLPAELPPAHSHDEPPGTSGHHGPAGLINPDPDQPADRPHH